MPGKKKGQRISGKKQTGGNYTNHAGKNGTKKTQNFQTRSNSQSPLSDVFHSFVRGASSSAAAQFTSSLGSSSQPDPFGDPGEFDLYLFAQSWAPRFCCTNKGKCKSENMDDMDDLSTHGLWPAYSFANNKGRTYPEYCGHKHLPDVKLKGRAQHEWSKHGTCTVLKPSEYFSAEVALAEKPIVLSIRDLLNEYAGENVAVDELVHEIGGPKKIAIMSNKLCQLEEITTCWAKHANGSVGGQIDCPDHVLGSSRNSAVLQRCKMVALDQTEGEKCAFISKEVLKILKSNPPALS